MEARHYVACHVAHVEGLVSHDDTVGCDWGPVAAGHLPGQRQAGGGRVEVGIGAGGMLLEEEGRDDAGGGRWGPAGDQLTVGARPILVGCLRSQRGQS